MTSLAPVRAAIGGTAPALPLSDIALSERQLKIGFGTAYRNTSSNFDLNGDKTDLASDASLETLVGSLFAQYGLSDELTMLTDIAFARNSVTAPRSSGSGNVSISSTGPSDSTFGLRYQPMVQPLRTILDLQVQVPLYSRLEADRWATLDSDSDAPLGTGITEFTLAGAFEFPLEDEAGLGFRLGYTARSGGFSNLLSYGSYVRYEERKGLYARFGAGGYVSMSDDQFSSFPPPALPKERANTVVGGSAAYNAIRPSLVELSFQLGTHIGRTFFVHGGVHYPVSGKNQPAQPFVVAAVGLDFGGKAAGSSYAHSNRGFQQYYLASRVIRVNNQLRQILIDRGKGDQIRVGEILDVFEPDRQDGTFGETVARGRVLEVGPTRSKIQVLEYFKESLLQEGFVVRRPVR